MKKIMSLLSRKPFVMKKTAHSKAIDFRYDDKKLALHSDTTQWQKKFGYNDLYDKVFDTFTSMNKKKYNFVYNGTPYVLWAWKGNYINLGAGAEVGFYKQNELLENADKNLGVEHWVVADTLPMTLSLYQRVKNLGNGTTYISCYHWLPDDDQWWITGFVPDIYDYGNYLLKNGFAVAKRFVPNISNYGVEESDLVHISSVDFEGREGMLEALNKEFKEKNEGKDLIFDMEDKKVWIIW